jgi:hypothetical protein
VSADISTSRKRKKPTPPAGSNSSNATLAVALATLQDAAHQLRRAGAVVYLAQFDGQICLIVHAPGVVLGNDEQGYLTIDGVRAVDWGVA